MPGDHVTRFKQALLLLYLIFYLASYSIIFTITKTDHDSQDHSGFIMYLEASNLVHLLMTNC